MSSRHFTQNQSSLKSRVDLNLPENSRRNDGFIPKFKSNILGTNNNRHFSKTEQHEKETMMTVRRNFAGDTEIRFPAGNSSQLIRDTQKLLNQYFGSKDNNDDVNSSTYSMNHTSTVAQDVPKKQHSDTETNLKPLHTRNMDNITNVFPQPKNSNTNSNKQVSYEKKILKDDPIIPQILDRKMIHLVGYVEHVVRWNEILKNVEINVIYNVLGTFINIINGTYPMEKYIFIKGGNGTVLECSFFEVDRPFPKIARGQFVGCIGNVIDTQKLRLYNVQILEDSDLDAAQRAIFLSQRMVHELNNRKCI